MQGTNIRIWQYGSNMDSDRINGPRRLKGSARVTGIARKDDYVLAFTHTNQHGVGVCDIIPATGDYVLGVVYEIPPPMLSVLDRIEGVPTGAYKRLDDFEVDPLDASLRRIDEPLRAKTYVVSMKETSPPPRTDADYANHILKGILEHKMGSEYCEKVKRIILKNNPDLSGNLLSFD